MSKKVYVNLSVTSYKVASTGQVLRDEFVVVKPAWYEPLGVFVAMKLRLPDAVPWNNHKQLA